MASPVAADSAVNEETLVNSFVTADPSSLNGNFSIAASASASSAGGASASGSAAADEDQKAPSELHRYRRNYSEEKPLVNDGKAVRSRLRSPHRPVRFLLPGRRGRGSGAYSRPQYLSPCAEDTSQTEGGNNGFQKSWNKLRNAGSAMPGANAAAAAGKRAARLGHEAARRSKQKAAKAVKALKAVQGEIDSVARLQRMLGIQKYTEDEKLQQLAAIEALLSPGDCLQYDLKVLQYYTSTEKDIELRNRRASAFIYRPAAQIFMAIVIIFNTLFLGISTMEVSNKVDNSGSSSSHNENLIKWNEALFVFLTVSNAIFAVIFFVEMILRIKCDRWAYFKDAVNLTDFFNAWLGIIDLFVTALQYTERIQVDDYQPVAAILRLLRLLRVLRFIRILEAFLPMRVLVEGIKASFFSLAYAVCFFIVLVYGFAVFFTTAFGTTRALQEYWGDLFTSMYTLFLILTMTNWDVIAAKTADYYRWAKAVVILYTVFSYFVLFNVVTAVIVEAFSTAAKRLQGEALHFAMFDECQSDEKTFRKAMTKSRLLSGVSGVSTFDYHSVAPSTNATRAHTCREASEGGGRTGSGESSKSSQAMAATSVPVSNKQELNIAAGGDTCEEDVHEPQSTKEACISAEESAESIGSCPSCDAAAQPTTRAPLERKTSKTKISSFLFSSFLRPSASLRRGEDGVEGCPTPSKRNTLRGVRGVLTTRSAGKLSPCMPREAESSCVELPAIRQEQSAEPSRTSAMVKRHAKVEIREKGGAAENFSFSPPPPFGVVNTGARPSAPSTSRGAEIDALPQPGVEEEKNGEAADDSLTGVNLPESFGVQVADATRENYPPNTSKAETFCRDQADITPEMDEGNWGRVYNEGLLPCSSLKTMPDGSAGLSSIDLRRYTPLQVLGSPPVQLAMRKCGISYIQAYDCLNILLEKGFEEVTEHLSVPANSSPY